VTFAEYNLFAEATKREKPDDRNWGRGNRPVMNVYWKDAVAYAEWLSEQTGQHYRLPTEAEWEYAARAGTQTAYAFGDDADKLAEYAWYKKNSKGQTHPVGQLQPNAWGLHDMHGNVYEWVQDSWRGSYAPEAVTDPQGPASGSARVVRGCGWGLDALLCRSAFRRYGAPGSRDSDLGFRLLRTAK
jgi:formylglycine-generating enzyme required for sulfatase activity